VTAVIETRALRRTFKTHRSEVVAVAGIDLDVRAGEVFGFLGPNGAGKTTTLRMLSTLLPITSGEAVVGGVDLRAEPARVRRRIGYVGQKGGIDPHVSGRDELLVQCRLHGMGASDAHTRTDELIGLLKLDSFADRLTQTYSGGQKRILEIALGLAHRPAILFLDEPTTGLDPQARARIWAEVQRLREGGTTIFLTTHYLEEADVLSDRVAIIDQGQIVASGTPDALKHEVAGDVVTLSVSGDQAPAFEVLRAQAFVRDSSAGDGALRLYVDRGEVAMPAILRLLEAAGLELRTISMARPSLDDVFLARTGRSLREEVAR
jgi:ABC-2 type transport system ATP-binding protein